MSLGEAAANVQALFAIPHCLALGEDEGFWTEYLRVAQGLAMRGNLAPAAHLAAVLRQNGAVKLSMHDKDFRKFDFLQVIDPMR